MEKRVKVKFKKWMHSQAAKVSFVLLVISAVLLDFVQKHKRINVNLQITKINRHISSFDFEDEYEEL